MKNVHLNKFPTTESLMDFYNSLALGDKTKLSNYLNIDITNLRKHIVGSRKINLKMALKIIIFSKGRLNLEDVRPDLGDFLSTKDSNFHNGELSSQMIKVNFQNIK